MEWLTDPWSSEIMRRAFAEAIVMGAVAGALGCFVLLRGLAFLGEAVAHTLILGVVIAFLLGGPIALGAGAAAALTVALSSALSADRRFSVDVSMGVLLPTFFGLAVSLIALTDGYRGKLEDTLFGAIFGVTDLDLVLAGGAALVTGLTLLFAGKELALATFDRAMASAMGYRLWLLDLLLFGLVTLAAVIALRAVGNVLLTAMLLGPALTARVLTRRFWPMVATAAGLGVLAGVLGLYWSWSSDVGGGAAIVLVVAALFTVVAGARAGRKLVLYVLRMRRIPGVTTMAVSLAALALALGISACGDDDEDGQAATGPGERVTVVATTMQLQDFARQVGGDRVEVKGILGPENEPHEYEPKPSDAEALTDADVVLENGANLDEWLDDLLANAGGKGKRVTAADGIELLPTEEEGFPGDPHVWHDPDNAKKMVDNVAAGLTSADPDGRADYQRNATAYKTKLDAMATQIREIFEPIAPEQRKLITTHDAFGYFVRAYDLEQVGTVLPAVTTDAEPSGRQIRDLVREIRAQDVKAIFTEEAVDAGLERQIADEAGATVSTSLYADVLGGPGSGAETLIDAELANARAMVKAWGS